MQIKINIAGKIATAEGNPYLVCGNSDDTILFTFDSEWKSYSAKTARFIYEVDGEEKYTEVAFTGTTCKIPEFYNIKKVDIGVYAGPLATTRCKINCKTSILDGEGSGETAHTEPGEDIYNQIIGICNEAVTAGNEAKAAAEGFEATTRETFGNALKGNIYGAAVRVDDVSPVEHKISCKVESKNLWKVQNTKDTLTAVSGFIYNYDNGVFSYSGTTTVGGGGRNDLLEKSWAKITLPAGTYTYSINVISGSLEGLTTYMQTIKGQIITMLPNYTFTLTEESVVFFGINKPSESGIEYNVSFNIQIERGDTATEYTPYVDPSTVTVKRCGKNFWRNETEKFPKTISGVTVEYDPETQIYTFNGTSTATGDVYTFPRDTKILNIKAGETWTLTTEVIGGNIDNKENPSGKLSPIINTAAYDNGLNTSVALSANKKFTQSADITKMYFYIYASNIVFNNFKCRVQLELSDKATEFEKFKEATKYTPSADGTVEGITSISPTTTLSTDTANAVISCEYNRDINAVIADLYNKITG